MGTWVHDDEVFLDSIKLRNIKYFKLCLLIQMSTWQYSSSEVLLYSSDGSEINMELFSENGEWYVAGSSVQNSTRYEYMFLS